MFRMAEKFDDNTFLRKQILVRNGCEAAFSCMLYAMGRLLPIIIFILIEFFGFSAIALTDKNHFDIRQMEMNGIYENFYIPTLNRRLSPPGKLDLFLWQRNPIRPDGRTVPVQSWDGGIKTGLHIQPLARALRQSGFADRPGATIVQISANEVGAYLNSRDIPVGIRNTRVNALMITPEYRFKPSERPIPFSDRNACLQVSFYLQVPTASDGGTNYSRSYVTFDIEFRDMVHHNIVSLNINVFHNKPIPKRRESTFYDNPTHSYNLFSIMNMNHIWYKILDDSAPHQSKPWIGYKKFNFEICQNEFQNAVNILAKKYTDAFLPGDARLYQMISFHLNAEILFDSTDSELGWSMKGLHVSNKTSFH